MKKLITILMVIGCLGSIGWSGGWSGNGISDTLTATTITASGAITGASLTTTGSAERITGNTYSTNFVDFNDSATAVGIDPAIYTDGSIYIRHATTAALYIRQPDGGCSKCTVDNAGTTWACVNMTCAGDM